MGKRYAELTTTGTNLLRFMSVATIAPLVMFGGCLALIFGYFPLEGILDFPGMLNADFEDIQPFFMLTAAIAGAVAMLIMITYLIINFSKYWKNIVRSYDKDYIRHQQTISNWDYEDIVENEDAEEDNLSGVKEIKRGPKRQLTPQEKKDDVQRKRVYKFLNSFSFYSSCSNIARETGTSIPGKKQISIWSFVATIIVPVVAVIIFTLTNLDVRIEETETFKNYLPELQAAFEAQGLVAADPSQFDYSTYILNDNYKLIYLQNSTGETACTIQVNSNLSISNMQCRYRLDLEGSAEDNLANAEQFFHECMDVIYNTPDVNHSLSTDKDTPVYRDSFTEDFKKEFPFDNNDDFLDVGNGVSISMTLYSSGNRRQFVRIEDGECYLYINAKRW